MIAFIAHHWENVVLTFQWFTYYLKIVSKKCRNFIKTIIWQGFNWVTELCLDYVWFKNHQHCCMNFKWEQPSFLFQCLWLPKPWWLVFVGLIEVSLVYRVLTASTLSLCTEGLINHCEDILAPHKSWVLWETELHQMANRIPCCSPSSHLWVINVHLVVSSNAWCLHYYIKGRIFCVYVNSIYWTASGFIQPDWQFFNTEKEDICNCQYI